MTPRDQDDQREHAAPDTESTGNALDGGAFTGAMHDGESQADDRSGVTDGESGTGG